jgi:hypothetical protein
MSGPICTSKVRERAELRELSIRRDFGEAFRPVGSLGKVLHQVVADDVVRQPPPHAHSQRVVRALSHKKKIFREGKKRCHTRSGSESSALYTQLAGGLGLLLGACYSVYWLY